MRAVPEKSCRRRDGADVGSACQPICRPSRGGRSEGLLLGSPTCYAFANPLAVPVPLFHPVNALDGLLTQQGQHDAPLGILAPSLAVRDGPLLAPFRKGGRRSVFVPCLDHSVR